MGRSNDGSIDATVIINYCALFHRVHNEVSSTHRMREKAFCGTLEILLMTIFVMHFRMAMRKSESIEM